MRTPTQEHPHHPTGIGTNTEQDIPIEQRRKSNSRLFQRGRKHRHGGGGVKESTLASYS